MPLRTADLRARGDSTADGSDRASHQLFEGKAAPRPGGQRQERGGSADMHKRRAVDCWLSGLPALRAEGSPEINLAGITFEANSAAIASAQAKQLRGMGLFMRDLMRDNPTELSQMKGHTDAIGDAGYGLLWSDRPAESAALALREYF